MSAKYLILIFLMIFVRKKLPLQMVIRNHLYGFFQELSILLMMEQRALITSLWGYFSTKGR